MSRPRREFRLGIIGGCLTHQPGIPLSQLYHRQLGRRLSEGEGILLKVTVARGFYDTYVRRLEQLLKDTAVDGVMIHVRNVFVRKAGLVSGFHAKGARRFVLHPFLFRRRRSDLTWEELEVRQFGAAAVLLQRDDAPRETDDRPLPGRRLFGFRLRELSHVLGALARLDHWAVEDELRLLEPAIQLCRARQIPLLVMGPTPMRNSLIKNRLCRQMNHALQARLSPEPIPFCALPALEAGPLESTHLRDGWHLNPGGHRAVAECLYPVITPWMRVLCA